MLALLAAEVDLEEAGERQPARAGLAVERLGDRRAVDRVDGAEQVERGADLVGLQGADQVPLDLPPAMSGAQLAALGQPLLDPVLAEDPQAGVPRPRRPRAGWVLLAPTRTTPSVEPAGPAAGRLDAAERIRASRSAPAHRRRRLRPAPPRRERGCACRSRTGPGCRCCGSRPRPAAGRGSCRRCSATRAALLPGRSIGRTGGERRRG